MKVFVFLPDGIGLRNFVFTKFSKIGTRMGFNVVYWNNTLSDLNSKGYNEVKIKKAKLHPLTEIFKNAKIQITLNQFIKRSSDKVYDSYRFPSTSKTFKTKLKTLLMQLIIALYNSESGLLKIGKIINKLERSTAYYQDSMSTLKKEAPLFVFCTNQRPSIAIAPIQAAKTLGIPTGTFIFSWDNLPKATMIVETDYYFVWSTLMRNELLYYYPNINEKQILVTGTPQFENHFNTSFLLEKETFFKNYNLDIEKKYICFSGDDFTTSPKDELYLRDVAIAVEVLNKKGYNLGIIFRRCPVDFTNRYDATLELYKDVITPINPLWEKNGKIWNSVMPTAEDLKLQTNIIAHTEGVVNLGSSMVFDYACYNKPCAFMNYNYLSNSSSHQKGVYVYNFVHFRSMPSKEAVVWYSNPNKIASQLENMLKNGSEIAGEANKWFRKVNLHPPQSANDRIWDYINNLKLVDA